MKIPTLVLTEFRRLTATGMARLALVALMLVPVIYAGLYLWANADPYGNVKNIPVALVVEDTGATVDGKTVDYGTQVHDQLHEDNSVKWIDTTASEAAAGIQNGEYDFILTLGPDFSTELTSAGSATPTQAAVQLTTNDTNSFLASTIAGQVAEKVRLSISEQVGDQAALQFLNGFSTIHDNVATAVDGADKLVDGTSQAQTGAASLADGAAKLNTGAAALSDGAAQSATGATTLASGASQTNDGAQSLSSGLAQLDSQASTLPSQASQLADGAAQVAAGNAQLAGGADQAAALAVQATSDVKAARDSIQKQLDAAGLTPQQVAAVLATLDPIGASVTKGSAAIEGLDGQVDALSAGAAQVATGTKQLSDAAPALATGISQAADGASQVAAGTQQVADGASRLASGTQQVADGASTLATSTQQLADGANALSSGAAELNTGASQLRDGLSSGLDQIPNYTPDQRSAAAANIATPARVDTDTVTKASTYGAGMAPFFISLAAWIGIYALFLIVKPLSKRALTAVKAPLRVSLAGWLAPAILGAIQMSAVFFVVTVPLGFSVANPALMLLFMIFTSITFTTIIHVLNVLLGSVGQFLGLVLMVLQLVTAGGTFPWQTLPAPLAALHQVLPMSYAVDGIRQLMYGGQLSLALNDAGVLGIWLLAAVAVAFLGARRMTLHRTLRDLRPSLIG